MPTAAFTESKIAAIEGFNVRLRFAGPGRTKGRDVRGDRMDLPTYGYRYRYLSGTWLAAPHVAGVIALLLAQGRSPAQAVDVLLATARTPGTGPGTWTPQYGHGIADAAAAVAAPR